MAGALGWWRAYGRPLLLVAWATLIVVALSVGWATARGSWTVRGFVALGLLTLSLYVYLRLRHRV